MRSVEEITGDKVTLLEKLRKTLDTKPQKDAAPLYEQLKELNAELDARISNGAKKCECGTTPMGMIKTPSYQANGMTMPAVYEVGCVHCPQFLVDTKDGERRRSVSARGFSPEEAVKNWNEGNWVEDTLFDRAPVDKSVPLSKGRKIAQFQVDKQTGATTIGYKTAKE